MVFLQFHPSKKKNGHSETAKVWGEPHSKILNNKDDLNITVVNLKKEVFVKSTSNIWICIRHEGFFKENNLYA